MARPALPLPVLLTIVVTVLVTLGALATAVTLRPAAEPRRDGAGASGCGDGPCRVLATATVAGRSVELLADAGGGYGRLRAGGPGSGVATETMITAMGARLNPSSLVCAPTGDPVCLVRAPHDGGLVGEVHILRDGAWHAVGPPYFSDAGSIVLDEVAGGKAPEVVVVEHDCTQVDTIEACQRAPVLAEVTNLSGDRLGCTRTHDSPGSLRGWPEVDVRAAELGRCPEP